MERKDLGFLAVKRIAAALIGSATIAAAPLHAAFTDVCPKQVVNIRPTSFVAVWATPVATTGYLAIGADPANPDQVACDLRDSAPPCDYVSSTHYVLVGGLTASTSYQVQFFTGGVADGTPQTVVTGPALVPGPSDLIFGNVYLSDGTTPAADTYLCASVRDLDGLGTPGSSSRECELIQSASSGFWTLNLSNARVADLSDRFLYSPSGDDVVQEACGGSAGCARQTIDTSEDAPSPSLALVECPAAGYTYCRDADEDGFGDPNDSIQSPDADPPAGFVADCADCDDSDPLAHPGASERCNDQDDDCDGIRDDTADAACDDAQYCNGAEFCSAGTCLAGEPIVCDDGDICTDDLCDEAEDRCDSVFDPSNNPTCLPPCPDADSDGFADCAGGSCAPGTLPCGDCNDANPGAHPGLPEFCGDAADNDCDGAVDAADTDCTETESDLRVQQVITPRLVRVQAGRFAVDDAKVFVRNDGDVPHRARVVLRTDSDGVEVIPLGSIVQTIRPGGLGRFGFRLRFSEDTLGDADRAIVVFNAVARDERGGLSEPDLPPRETVVVRVTAIPRGVAGGAD